MTLHASEPSGRWLARRIILGYFALGSALLAAAIGLTLIRTGGWEERVFSVLPRYSTAAEVNKQKIHDALEALPGTLAKLGIALLGIAAVTRFARSFEAAGDDACAEGEDRPADMGPHWLDRIAPAVLAAVVFVQVAPSLGRPLIGDELENYQKHLTLSLKGVLTTMEGANNQLGFTLLSWTSMRALGDSPTSVRLPAMLGGMLLPALAYLLGRREFGRPAAMALGTALALWPDCTLAAMQGRSYSLLMLASVIHLWSFRRFVNAADPRVGLVFGVSLAAACTLHLWFVLVVGGELIYLYLLKAFGRRGERPAVGVETFLVCLTLGGLGAAVIQAGILPKFLYVLTQKNPTPVGVDRVLANIGRCHLGLSFDNGQVDADFRGSWRAQAVRTAIDLLLVVGVVASAIAGRRDAAARFRIGSYLAVAATFFVVVTIQKPVYIYERFFVFLPLSLFWVAADGWAHLLRRPALDGQPARLALALEGRGRRDG